MKKIISPRSIAFLFLFSLMIKNGYSQAPPQGINYQAVARASSGGPVVSMSIDVRFTIWDAVTGGTDLFEETHTGIITNVYGFFCAGGRCGYSKRVVVFPLGRGVQN